MDKGRLVPCNPLPRLFPGTARAIGLVPLEIPDPRHVVDSQVAHQPVTQAPGPHASNEQDILVLITQNIDSGDRRDAVQIAGIPPLGTLVLFHFFDHSEANPVPTEYCGSDSPETATCRNQRQAACTMRIQFCQEKTPYVEIKMRRLTISCGKAVFDGWTACAQRQDCLWITK